MAGVVEPVEQTDAGAVDERDGQFEGDRKARAFWPAGQFPALRVPAPEQHAPAQFAALGEAVHPGDGIGPFGIAFGGNVPVFAQAGEADLLLFDGAGSDGLEPELRPGDQAGETQSADGGGEPFGILVRTADDALAVGAQQFQPGDVTPEGAVGVMILAVDVVGDGAAHGGVAGAGCHWQEPAAGHNQFEDIAQRQTCLAAQQAGLFVEGDEVVQGRSGQQAAAVVEAAVAVAAAAAVGQKGVGRAGRQGIGSPARRADLLLGVEYAAPGGVVGHGHLFRASAPHPTPLASCVPLPPCIAVFPPLPFGGRGTG